MFKKFIKLFTDRKVWVRQVIVAGLAGAFAWQLGDILIRDGGVVAAIVCSLSIRISLHKSVREGFGQIVGTAIGASVALTSVWLFSFGFISVGITIVICSVVARALHLGEVASVNVPVTALIVIGPGLSETTALHRLGSTLIGAAVAIIFSYFSHAKTPAARAEDKIAIVSAKAADLLAVMSEGVAAGYSLKNAGTWLAKARLLIEEIPSIRSQGVEARGHARWFPTAEKDEAEEIYIKGIALEHTLVQVRTIARTLFDSAVSGGIAESTKKQIAVALSAASYAITAKFEEGYNAEDMETSATDDARDAGAALAETLIEDAKDADQEQIVRGLSMVANIDRIADSLDENSPALTEVMTPDEPAHVKIMAVSPIDQTLKLNKRIKNRVKKLFSKYL
jgi:hypothetical protein